MISNGALKTKDSISCLINLLISILLRLNSSLTGGNAEKCIDQQTPPTPNPDTLRKCSSPPMKNPESLRLRYLAYFFLHKTIL